jgi:hypothetical protein
MDRSGKAMRKAIAFAAAVVVALAATAAVVLPAEAQENGQCDPNYDPCVPIASDVDCLGGSGDGPEFVAGPVTVIGEDIYGLDDGGEPGVGCEGDGAGGDTDGEAPAAEPVEEEPDFTG